MVILCVETNKRLFIIIYYSHKPFFVIGIARRPVQEAGLFNRTREAQPGFR